MVAGAEGGGSVLREEVCSMRRYSLSSVVATRPRRGERGTCTQVGEGGGGGREGCRRYIDDDNNSDDDDDNIMLSWTFEHDYLDTCCFECLKCVCFVFLSLHAFSAIEHVSHGKAL